VIGGVPGPLQPLLRSALLRRRRELADLLRDPPGAAARHPFVVPQADEDPEEILRRVMVHLWPAMRRAPFDGTARDAFFAQLGRLEEAARGGDPRFLDVWNHAYEAIASWPVALREEGAARFTLESYARILDHHLEAARAGVA
jgi:hypothetical protein